MWRGLYKGLPGLASVFLQKNNSNLAGPVFREKSHAVCSVLRGRKGEWGFGGGKNKPKSQIGAQAEDAKNAKYANLCPKIFIRAGGHRANYANRGGTK
ncbi:hypothetical protein CSC3H3_07425 [Thalassospira marina]|uniref:Uncharacterized protein n=1 Tax=Thalassospira marina TaxID=2048283 RepID=A0ABM6Q7U2_9PROT|nr:hypothetical protein CSC3H3_07425 [Thalassospira marina]